MTSWVVRWFMSRPRVDRCAVNPGLHSGRLSGDTVQSSVRLKGEWNSAQGPGLVAQRPTLGLGGIQYLVTSQGRPLRGQPWAALRSPFRRQKSYGYSPEGRMELSPRSRVGRAATYPGVGQNPNSYTPRQLRTTTINTVTIAKAINVQVAIVRCQGWRMRKRRDCRRMRERTF